MKRAARKRNWLLISDELRKWLEREAKRLEKENGGKYSLAAAMERVWKERLGGKAE